MAFIGIRSLVRAVAGVALLALAAPGLGEIPAHAASTPTWVANNAKTKTATLTVIAGYKGGFDFNGYMQGKMTITVPVGYHVNVVFSNNAALPHSLVFTTYDKRTAASGITAAFKGASTPNPTSGTAKGKTEKFSFVANKVGTYAMVCAVPGHALAGMWDVFTVAKSGTPGIKFSK
jgi:sulfocyanin